MEQPKHILERGVRIKTNEALGSTTGMTIKPEYLKPRKTNAKGLILGCVAGHGGDVYWVSHGGALSDPVDITAYTWSEFEVIRENRMELVDT